MEGITNNRFTIRLLLIGFGIGLLFPSLGIVIELFRLGLDINEENLLKIHEANWIFYLLDSAPFVLALVFYFLSIWYSKTYSHLENDLNVQLENIGRVTQFAEKIGNGELKAVLESKGANDTLANSLIEMRNNLIKANQKEDDRNWIITGVAEVGMILRSADKLSDLSEKILPYLSKRVEALQGAFYVVNDDDEDNEFIEMTGSYAYNKKKYLEAKFKFGQGLVGQAAIEKNTVFRTEIPYNYVYITSGLLGDRRPKSILIVPLMTDEKVYGVVELASLSVMTPLQINFIQELSEIIARTIFSLKVNERTIRLLSESQQLSEELQQRQEQLNQNAEEMRATQEELRRSNIKLEEQIEEVNNSQKRIHVLLENSSEIITICDADGKLSYVSPSVHVILGYSPEELVGTYETERVNELGVEDFKGMLTSVIQHPTNKATIQYSYKSKTGEMIWMEATAKNMLKDSAINGIVINARDITERRRAEKESRMRSQMQSLSENSPDLITRVSKEGKIYYINPVIGKLTSFSPDDFLQKRIKDAPFTELIKTEWEQIVWDVVKTREKLNKEMAFASLEGNRVMSVNAIPEFGSDESLESILLVSSDITDRKAAEQEIQNKNKKITESINYAQRIQHAILPDNNLISKVFPSSFMFYKPRDVVSGDFPWYTTIGDDHFIAVVDCTGHGVPGALLSLIGYFILNDIVKSRKISEPGKILDMLDEGVTKTLKQDEADSVTKDGMDISLCKVNFKTKKLEYAGAHRPLYYFNGEEIEEFKGNKFPIGGGIYKNQTSFTNYTVEFKKGDSFYFFSDGFPDQFGGPENKKFGPAKIRSLVAENKKTKNMKEMHQLFATEFEDWMGNHKQMDDVLLIGIEV
jgi:PAS domain S-box-containing protein